MFDFKPTTHYIINTGKCQQPEPQKSRAFNSLSFRGKRGYTMKASSITIRPSLEDRNGKTFGGILMYTRTNNPTLYALVQGRATGKWSFPKGHSNPDEGPLDCAKREIAEETSIELLPEPITYIKMGYGHYYIFELTEQLPLVAKDTTEVMDTIWVTLEEMMRLPLNADASLFVKKKTATMSQEKNTLNNKDELEDAECQNR
jgi:8-oxo-dGTP pyrophosphatase MutT (NUDIX family)